MIVIYALVCPIAETIRYIGKTNDPEKRLAQHISQTKAGRKQHQRCSNWIKNLRGLGLRPSMRILYRVAENEDWRVIERRLIAEHREAGYPLTNLAAGGEGWQDMPPEVVDRMRESLSRYLMGPEGVEHRRKMRAAAATPQAKAKHRASRVAYLSAPGVRERMAEAGRAQAMRPGAKEKLSSAGRAAWANLSPDEFLAACAARSETLKAKFADPAVRAARVAAMQTPDARAKRAAARAASMEATRSKLRASWQRRKAEKSEATHA